MKRMTCLNATISAMFALCGCTNDFAPDVNSDDSEFNTPTGAPDTDSPTGDSSSDSLSDPVAEASTEPTPDDPGPYVVFVDEGWGGTTTDVRDVDDEVVRFHAANESLVWVADGSEFDGWPAEGLFLGPSAFFQVRFGVKAGRRLAFFTESGPATVCDVRVEEGQLSILPTNVSVPE